MDQKQRGDDVGRFVTKFKPRKIMPGKSSYSLVTLRVTWNSPFPCEVGDELVTRTGRRYQVMEMKGKAFHCMILPNDATVQSTQHKLVWNQRSKRDKRDF